MRRSTSAVVLKALVEVCLLMNAWYVNEQGKRHELVAPKEPIVKCIPNLSRMSCLANACMLCKGLASTCAVTSTSSIL